MEPDTINICCVRVALGADRFNTEKLSLGNRFGDAARAILHGVVRAGSGGGGSSSNHSRSNNKQQAPKSKQQATIISKKQQR